MGELQSTSLALASSSGQPVWLVQPPLWPAGPSGGDIFSYYAGLRDKTGVPGHSRES